MNILFYILGWSCIAYTLFEIYNLSRKPAPPARVRAWDKRTGKELSVTIIE